MRSSTDFPPFCGAAGAGLRSREREPSPSAASGRHRSGWPVVVWRPGPCSPSSPIGAAVAVEDAVLAHAARLTRESAADVLGSERAAVADVEAPGVEVEEGADAAMDGGHVVGEEGKSGSMAPEEAALEEVADDALAAVQEEGDGAGGVSRGGQETPADAVAGQVCLPFQHELRLEGGERGLGAEGKQRFDEARNAVGGMDGRVAAATEGTRVGAVDGHGSAREAAQVGGAAEVVQVAMAEHDQPDGGGVKAISADRPDDAVGAARLAGVDEDRPLVLDEVGVD